MAGKLIVDTLQTESTFLQMNVGTTRIATMNASGIFSNTGTKMIGYDGSIGVATIANTAIDGVITASQLAPSLNLATNNVQVASIQSATGTPAITFAANGQITTANTPLILTGGQIKFPGTQIASSDGNTLDDYEEGTFTLTITPGSGSLTTYDSYGYYVKIGRHVTITCAFSIINAGTASGVANFGGLPFTSLNPTALATGGNRAGTSAWREDGSQGNWFFGRNDPNATSGTITTSTNGGITWTNGYAYVSSFVYESAV